MPDRPSKQKKSCTKGRTYTSTLQSAEADIVCVAAVSTAEAIEETEETIARSIALNR
ncbi:MULTISPECIES: hypothetical protein [unclassified Microcoleus]|uniref:hypothetical protein n=1 Tax=unclassified Microcoleus TaxID=2642155 RepID=UPI002FD62F1B